MATIKDTIISQIPGHVLENYPRFFEFLEAYYEWLNQEGNPYERIKHHMDYLDFQKSMDSYVEHMKNEYLHDVPDSVLVDKELFIKWSKKFNLARGSHASYKFLFKLLFDEQDINIYLPKENILKTSDGDWVSGESKMLLTNTAPLVDFSFKILEQEREVGAGEFEFATAVIQSSRIRRTGRYDLIELSVTDIDGTFERGYPVTTEVGGEAWLVDTISSIDIQDGGINHQTGERIVFDDVGEYVIERDADVDGEFDTRVTSRFSPSQLRVFVNSSEIFDFDFDGRTVTSTSILETDTIEVRLPAHAGYMNVGEVDENGSIIQIDILETPIGTNQLTYTLSNDGYGTGFVGEANTGLASQVNGYYKDNKGQLSSNMYLQDGFYYQNYSYAIQTIQDISKYGDIVKELLHPAGFQMFGIMNVINVIELILELVESEENVLPTELPNRNKYSLGPNYSFFDRFKSGLSKRLYRLYHFRDEAETGEYPVRYRYDSNHMVGDHFIYMEDGYVEDTDDYVEEVIYNLEDSSLERTYLSGSGGYFDQFYFESGYFQSTGKWFVPVDGWMTKHYLVDYHLFIPQDYSEEVESGYQYFETGYVTERAA